MVSQSDVILLPEADSPVVAELAQMDTGLNLRIEQMTLSESAAMLRSGEVAAVVAGATNTSADVIRTGIKELGTQNKLVSSFFVMEKEGQPRMFFADCAVVPRPDVDQLVMIAEQTCENVRLLGEKAVVAFISYSTEGSAGHRPEVQEVQAAANKFIELHPDIPAIGEVQWDAATDKEIYRQKTKKDGYPGGSPPNIFIFPSLEAGNLAYKMMQDPRVGGWTAIGPLLQGFKDGLQLHDLSRGVKAPDLLRICQVVAELNGIDKQQSQLAKAA